MATMNSSIQFNVPFLDLGKKNPETKLFPGFFDADRLFPFLYAIPGSFGRIDIIDWLKISNGIVFLLNLELMTGS
jgi:hypothetical protein